MDKYYLLEWFKEYEELMRKSSLGTFNFKIELEVFSHPKYLLLSNHLYSIYESFRELVRTYYYSLSAYKIEKELKEEKKNAQSNYWKFEVKNYYFRTIIPRFNSLLDYIAMMINELSQRKLEKNLQSVNFKKIKGELKKCIDKVGWLSYEEIVELNNILSWAYLDEQERKFLNDFRNITTHRYFIGIDELTVMMHSKRLTKPEKEKFKTSDEFTYEVSGKPHYTFEELNKSVNRMINSLDLMISKLMEMGYKQGVVNKT